MESRKASESLAPFVSATKKGERRVFTQRRREWEGVIWQRQRRGGLAIRADYFSFLPPALAAGFASVFAGVALLSPAGLFASPADDSFFAEAL